MNRSIIIVICFLLSCNSVTALGIAVSPPSLVFEQSLPQYIFVQNPESYAIMFSIQNKTMDVFPQKGTLLPYETKQIRIVPRGNVQEKMLIVAKHQDEEVSVAIMLSQKKVEAPSILLGLLILAFIPVLGFTIFLLLKRRI